MNFSERKEAALAELEKSGIWRSNYKPAALLLLWKLGLQLRPPHYNRFYQNALFLGLWFALVWGVLMWFFQWRTWDISILAAVALSIAAGAFFGIFMAIYYERSARKHGLSRWDDLVSENKGV